MEKRGWKNSWGLSTKSWEEWTISNMPYEDPSNLKCTQKLSFIFLFNYIFVIIFFKLNIITITINLNYQVCYSWANIET